MRVIVGLGNPGPRFARSRHNVGFWCIDRLARSHNLVFKRQRKVLLAQGHIGEQPVALAKPRTFMNLSGEAVRYLVDRFRARPADLVIVYDDMDLPVGKIRIRVRGSSGGHQGLNSTIGHLGTQSFPRVRIGIGHPLGTGDIGHVLGRFRPEEEDTVREAVQQAAEALEVILAEGLDAAMNGFN